LRSVYSILLAFLFFNKSAFSVDINILSFGAIPNDLVNDSRAFIAAANFINGKKGNVTLIIPSGKYIVGQQNTKENTSNACFNCAEQSTLIGVDILSLKSCKNVKIIGVGKVEIVFERKLSFGGFKMQGREATKANFDEATKKDFSKMHRMGASIGSLIALADCSFVTIENINSNGNSDSLKLGDNIGIGLNAFELSHYGLAITNSDNITVKFCKFNNYGLDGMYITNDSLFTRKNTKNNIKVLNSNFDRNGRQGLSIVGVDGIFVSNSTFNKTGSGKIQTAPGCGIDIEPTFGICKNGYFSNCEFMDNAGFGIGINDYIKGSEGFTFVNCKVIGSKYYTIGTSMPKVRFDKCDFYGETIFSFNASKPEDATIYKGCRFYDVYKNKNMYSFGGALLFIKLRGTYLKVENCKFLAKNNLAFFIDRENHTDVASNSLFINNQITCKLANHRFNLSSVSYGISFQKNSFYSKRNMPFQMGSYNVFQNNVFKTIE
jgi:Right handed beta helix region